MDLGSSESDFLQQLAARSRVLLLGRAATVAHGGPFVPREYEVWLEPMENEASWVQTLHHFIHGFLHLRLCALPGAEPLTTQAASEYIAPGRPVCVAGFAVPIWVHRLANEFRLDEFDRVWGDASPILGAMRLPSLMDTFLNKINTRRHQDYEEMVWLEEQVRGLFAARLPHCDESEASRLLARYIDPESLRHALDNANPSVREMALAQLRRFAESGDPYSQQILEELGA